MTTVSEGFVCKVSRTFGDFKRMTDFDLSRAIFLTISALTSLTFLFTAPAALAAPVKHDQGTGAIAKSVTVPPGYDTIYFSGLGPTIAPGQTPGDTEAQATRALEAIKKNLADPSRLAVGKPDER